MRLLSCLLLGLALGARAQVNQLYPGVQLYPGFLLSPTAAPAEQTLTNGLVGYWGMDAYPTVLDKVGANNLVNEAGLATDVAWQYYDGANYSFGAIDAGINWSANRDRYAHAANSDLNVGPNGSFTISAWANNWQAADLSSYPVLVDKGCFFDNGGFLLYWQSGTGLRFVVGNGTEQAAVGSSTPVVNNRWFHIVGRYNYTNATLSIFVDGTNKNDYVWTASNKQVANNADAFSVGLPSTGTSYGWPSVIDDIGYWNRALTDAEIKSLHDYGLVGQGYPWTNSPRTTWDTVIFQGSARFMTTGTATNFMNHFRHYGWTRSHAPLLTFTNMTAMYVNCPYDALYPPLTNQYSWVTNLIGPNTNVFVVLLTGENDLMANSVTPSWVLSGLEVAHDYTNYMRMIHDAGANVILMSHYPMMVADEYQIQLGVLNQATTNNAPSWLKIFDASTLCPTNGPWYGTDAELNDAGHIRVATNFDNWISTQFPGW